MPGIVRVDVVDLRVGQKVANGAVMLAGSGDARSDEAALCIERSQAQRAPREHRWGAINQRRDVLRILANKDCVGRAIWPVDVMTDVVEQDQCLARRGVLEAHAAGKAEIGICDDAVGAARRQLGIAQREQRLGAGL